MRFLSWTLLLCVMNCPHHCVVKRQRCGSWESSTWTTSSDWRKTARYIFSSHFSQQAGLCCISSFHFLLLYTSHIKIIHMCHISVNGCKAVSLCPSCFHWQNSLPCKFPVKLLGLGVGICWCSWKSVLAISAKGCISNVFVCISVIRGKWDWSALIWVKDKGFFNLSSIPSMLFFSVAHNQFNCCTSSKHKNQHLSHRAFVTYLHRNSYLHQSRGLTRWPKLSVGSYESLSG